MDEPDFCDRFCSHPSDIEADEVSQSGAEEQIPVGSRGNISGLCFHAPAAGIGRIPEGFDASFRNFTFLESHIYIIALLGLVIFYGLEQLAKKSKQESEKS